MTLILSLQDFLYYDNRKVWHCHVMIRWRNTKHGAYNYCLIFLEIYNLTQNELKASKRIKLVSRIYLSYWKCYLLLSDYLTMGPTNYWAHRSWELSPRLKQSVLNLHCIGLLSGNQPKVHFDNRLMSSTLVAGARPEHNWEAGRPGEAGARPRSVMARPRSQVHQHRHRLTITCHWGLLSTLFTFSKPLVHIL